MFSNILGAIWVILGLIWLIKPQVLRNRLQRKMTRRMRWIVLGFILTFVVLMIGSVIKAPGLLYKVVGIVGIVIVIKSVLFMTSKASGKMADWLANRPVIFFRAWGLVILIIGAALLLA